MGENLDSFKFSELPLGIRPNFSSRRAIASWQTSRQLPTTGFLTSAQKLTLETQSEEAYQLALTTPAESEPTVRNVKQPSRRAGTRVASEEPVAVTRRRAAPVRTGGGGFDARHVGSAIGIMNAFRGGGFRIGF